MSGFPEPIPKYNDLPTRRSAGVAKIDASVGSSVFTSPRPGVAPESARSVLDSPGTMSKVVAEMAALSLAPKVLGGQKKLNPGAGWFARINPDDLKVENLGERQEGAEYAMVLIKPTDLERLDTSDIGGKFRVSDEAIEEGVTDIIRDGLALITNAITERLDAMTVAALDAAVASTGHGITTGHQWGTVQLTGATPTAAAETPAADIINAATTISTAGLLAQADMLVLHPSADALLRIGYGAGYGDLLTGLGMTVVTSKEVAVNSAYVLDSVNVGGVVSKHGIVTETWRAPEIRSTWAQTYLEPAVYVSRPGNVVRIDGII